MPHAVAYHRSNLRQALLARAIVVLRERGAQALSLRELARELGVSHTAPARHFANREQLLEAVAVHGFDLLAARLRDAISSSGDPRTQAQLAARAHVAFATSEANLIDEMVRHKGRRDDVVVHSAAAVFAPLLEVFHRGEQVGLVPHGDAASAATLFLAALQGIAVLVNCGVVLHDDVPVLIDDVVPRFIAAARGDAPDIPA